MINGWTNGHITDNYNTLLNFSTKVLIQLVKCFTRKPTESMKHMVYHELMNGQTNGYLTDHSKTLSNLVVKVSIQLIKNFTSKPAENYKYQENR